MNEPAYEAEPVPDGHGSVVDLPQHQADEIRRSAERDAEEIRREAIESVRRLRERMKALERPFGELMQALQVEVERVERELGSTDAPPMASAAEPHVSRPSPPEPDRQESPRKGGGLRSRLRVGTKSTTFITTEGHCAVCRKPFMAGSEENLAQSGWKVNGDVGLCPECQADSWQLPDGASRPFRSGGGRSGGSS